MADVTNNPLDKLVRRGDAPTNSVFGPYDSRFVNAIEHHWRELLDASPWSSTTKKGEVAVDFRLHADGHVSDFRIAHSTADEKVDLICQKAVLESSPFAPWPQEMRQAVTNNLREIHFTFYINP
jgi:TonB family protein